MKYIKRITDSLNSVIDIESEGYKYTISLGEIPKPGEYGYLNHSYNDGKKGIIVRILNERMYPSAKIEGDYDSYKNVWKVEIINKSEIAPYKGSDKNYKGKIYFPESYHLSHFKNGGKIISTNNPNIKV
jgi:hypothetical protein